MPGSPNSAFSQGIARKLTAALRALWEATEYADDTNDDRWSFAVPISQLRELGANETDMRWLVRKGFVHHAREVTAVGQDGRHFTPTGDLTFTRRTCFVLTDVGVTAACQLEAITGQTTGKAPSSAPYRDSQVIATGFHDSGNGQARPIVHWNSECRKLCVNGVLVKRFKWPAVNQEAVLSAFQEEGWPERIDDPLPPHPDQEPKRRLSDTIKCLNRNQTCERLRFHGDGTGEGILWELLTPHSCGNDA